jgi:hypothetical protein
MSTDATHTPSPSEAPSDRLPWVQGLLGLLLGAGLVWGLLEVSQLYPYSFTHGRPALPAVPAAPSQPVDLSISFIETAESQTVGTHLAQGLGWGKRRVAFRAALIRHPKGTILFGTGLSPEHNERHVGWKVGTPFAASKPLTSLAQLYPSLGVDRIILPSMRWYNTGGLLSLPSSVRAFAGSGEISSSTGSSWPYRYAYDLPSAQELRPRLSAMSFGGGSYLGGRKSDDLFDDGSVVAVTYRASGPEEIALLVSLTSGRRLLLVGDAVFSDEQVKLASPSYQPLTWWHDRNRMQLASLVTKLSALELSGAVDVLPMLDGTVPVPLFPASWK